jgi:hypothetical protein
MGHEAHPSLPCVASQAIAAAWDTRLPSSRAISTFTSSNARNGSPVGMEGA